MDRPSGLIGLSHTHIDTDTGTDIDTDTPLYSMYNYSIYSPVDGERDTDMSRQRAGVSGDDGCDSTCTHSTTPDTSTARYISDGNKRPFTLMITAALSFLERAAEKNMWNGIEYSTHSAHGLPSSSPLSSNRLPVVLFPPSHCLRAHTAGTWQGRPSPKAVPRHQAAGDEHGRECQRQGQPHAPAPAPLRRQRRPFNPFAPVSVHSFLRAPPPTPLVSCRCR